MTDGLAGPRFDVTLVEEVPVIEVEITSQGPKGNPGNPGYTPVKGVDYFTAAEVQRFETDILAQVQPAVNNANTAADAATRAAVDAKTAAANAKTTANAAAYEATVAANTANAAANNAGTAAISANRAASRADASVSQADISAAKAREAGTDADRAAKLANEAAEDAYTAAEQATDISNLVQRKLDLGEFDGPRGPKGDPGVNGTDGKDGHDYVVTEADYEAIAEVVKTDISPELSELKSDLSALEQTVDGKAKLYKLFFDGADIYWSEHDWEEGLDPMTFAQIRELCYQPQNFVYIGDGSSKYYPTIDLDILTREESIQFIASGMLGGRNYQNRVIINEYNEVKYDQIVDVPMAEFTAMQAKLAETEQRLADFIKISKGIIYDVESDSAEAYSKTVPLGGFKARVLDVGGKSRVANQLSNPTTVKNGTRISPIHYSFSCPAGDYVTFDNAAESVSGHKYLVQFKTDEDLMSSASSSNGLFKYYSSQTFKNAYPCIVSDATTGQNTAALKNETQNTVSGNVTMYVVDLTQWFGAGNEPNEVTDPRITEVEAWLDVHPEYNAGEIIHADFDRLDVRNASQVITDSIPIPSAIRNLEGYGWSAGTAKNDVKYAEKKYDREVGRIDIGTLNWFFVAGSNSRFQTQTITAIKAPSANNVVVNGFCERFETKSVAQIYSHIGDKTIGVSGNGELWCYNSEISDVATLKAALAGVYFYHELATPEEIDISDLLPEDFLQNIEVESGGSITFHQSDEGVRLPVPNTTEYAIALNERSAV